MQNGTTIALSRLVAQQRAMDVIANNVANANTSGFRAGRTLFSDWILRQPAQGRPPGERTLAFVQDHATWREREPGPIATTGNPLDLAIGEASGWFTVDSGNGARLTRAGHFNLSANGQIVDDAGGALLDRSGKKLQVKPGDTHLTVGADGSLSSENGRIGVIGVVAARDEMRLTPEGDLHMRADTATTPVAAPRIVQGAVEGSNVQAVAEIARMMTGLREFQFVSQYVQGESERQSNAIDKLAQRPAGS